MAAGRRGIPTTVANYGDWPALAQDAIQRYKNGRLRSIMIVGHSLGGDAAVAMAAELGRAGVPVQLVATLDPVGGSEVSSNVRRSVNIRPRDGEDHFSVIAAHDRDLSSYVLGEKRFRGARAAARHALMRLRSALGSEPRVGQKSATPSNIQHDFWFSKFCPQGLPSPERIEANNAREVDTTN